jgi:hypothetical protein
MKIRWDNLIAAMLALAGVVVLIRYRAPIAAFLAGVERVGPGFSPDDQAMGLIAFGIVGVLLVAIVKILVQGRDR